MKKLSYVFEQLNIPSDKEMISKLYEYMDLVLKKNEFINLTSITDPEEFLVKHVMDSIVCYGWKEIEEADKIIDVGTGAGFPGVPLAILYPNKRFLLMDSLNKRLEFIKESMEKLNINNMELLHSRAEDAAREKSLRQNFDLCVSRAVANLSTLSEYCIPFLKKGGNFYAYKTKNSLGEIDDSQTARQLLGASEKVEVKETKIPGFHLDHNILIIHKIRNTPSTYPRKAGIPSRVPL